MKIITPEMIEKAEGLKACKKTLEWLRKKPRTFYDLAIFDLGGYFWAAKHMPDVACVEEIVEIVKERSLHTVLIYAPTLLTAEELDVATDTWPDLAIRYAAELITPERLAWCKEEIEDNY